MLLSSMCAASALMSSDDCRALLGELWLVELATCRELHVRPRLAAASLPLDA